jgi:hypothetical protein
MKSWRAMMRRRTADLSRSTMLAIMLVALLAGCAGYTLVAPGRVVVKDSFSVAPGTAWNKVNPTLVSGPVETWTLDGPSLNTLTFFAGIQDGEPLAARQPSGSPPPPPLPVFRKTMSESEIVELFEATMARGSAGTSFSSTSVKPATMGGEPGFLLEFAITTRDQVDRKGLAMGAVKDGRLYLIVYIGTRLYHFGRDRDAIEALFASVRFV